MVSSVLLKDGRMGSKSAGNEGERPTLTYAFALFTLDTITLMEEFENTPNILNGLFEMMDGIGDIGTFVVGCVVQVVFLSEKGK